jgi:hypothetical protein
MRRCGRSGGMKHLSAECGVRSAELGRERVPCCVRNWRAESSLVKPSRTAQFDLVKAGPKASECANWAGAGIPNRLFDSMRVHASRYESLRPFIIFMKLHDRAGAVQLCANEIAQGATVWRFEERFGPVSVSPIKSNHVRPAQTKSDRKSGSIKMNQSESNLPTGATRWRGGGTKWRKIGLCLQKSRQIKGNQAPARAFFPGASVSGHD